MTGRPLSCTDGSLPADPSTAIARRLLEQVEPLPIISPTDTGDPAGGPTTRPLRIRPRCRSPALQLRMLHSAPGFPDALDGALDGDWSESPAACGAPRCALTTLHATTLSHCGSDHASFNIVRRPASC